MSTLTLGQRNTLVTRTKLIADITGSDEDALLEILIDDIWDKMETELDRDILSTSKDEIINVGEDGLGVLSNPDVSGLDFIGTSFESAFTVSYSGSDIAATIEVTDTSVILRSFKPPVFFSTTSTFASNTSITAMVATLDAQAGWAATEKNNADSTLLERRGVQAVSTGTTTLRSWKQYDSEYQTNYKIGMVDFENTLLYDRGFPYNQVRIKYTAGFSAIPNDVELEVILAAKAAWNMKDKDMAVKSEKLGDYSYSLASQVVIDPSGNLKHYRRVGL